MAGNKESLQKLDQTTSLKSKMIFRTYQFLLEWRNKFLFSNMLVLYDYILMRNHEIIQNKELRLRAYLSGSFDIMTHNMNNIKSIYHDYVESAVKLEQTSVDLNEVLKIAKSRQDSRDVMASILPALNKVSIGSASMVRERRSRNSKPQSDKNNSIKYDLKILKLNTEYPGMDQSAGRHVFVNILEGDERGTSDYQKVRIPVLLVLSAQALLSNWNYVCYLLMIIYTFANGGLNGFIYANAIIIFVLVEDNMPGIVFWKTCFFNTATAFWMKQLLNGFISQLVDNQILTISTKDYFQIYSQLLFGSASFFFEILIMIAIMVELVLLDEIGFKKKKMIECEDSNESYIRMKINKIFELRESEKFKVYISYLKALFEGTKLGSTTDATQTMSKDRKKSQKKAILVPKPSEEDKEDIKIDEVIDYEHKRNMKKTEVLKDTIKEIEHNIFIKSFGKVTEENRKSFSWKLFTVYVRSDYRESKAWHRSESSAQLHLDGDHDLHDRLHRGDVGRHAVLRRPGRAGVDREPEHDLLAGRRHHHHDHREVHLQEKS
jgi:hypothetical protein